MHEQETRRRTRACKSSDYLADYPDLKPLTSVQMRLIESASEIREAQPDDIAFQHSVLCQTSLPYRSTLQRRWEAQNGNVTGRRGF